MLTAGARQASRFATVLPQTDAFSLFLIRSFAAKGFGIAIALLNVPAGQETGPKERHNENRRD